MREIHRVITSMDAPNDLNASDGFSDFKSDRIPIKRKKQTCNCNFYRVIEVSIVCLKCIVFLCVSICMYSILFRIRYKLPFVLIFFRSNLYPIFFFRDRNYFFNNTQNYLVIISLFFKWFNLRFVNEEIDIFLKFPIIFHTLIPIY